MLPKCCKIVLETSAILMHFRPVTYCMPHLKVYVTSVAHNYNKLVCLFCDRQSELRMFLDIFVLFLIYNGLIQML